MGDYVSLIVKTLPLKSVLITSCFHLSKTRGGDTFNISLWKCDVLTCDLCSYLRAKSTFHFKGLKTVQLQGLMCWFL